MKGKIHSALPQLKKHPRGVHPGPQVTELLPQGRGPELVPAQRSNQMASTQGKARVIQEIGMEMLGKAWQGDTFQIRTAPELEMAQERRPVQSH